MDKVSNTLQPIAMKIANQKFLVALRNAFIGTMPVVMAGSIAVLLNAFLVDFPMEFGFEGITGYFQWLIDINNLVFGASISVISLLFIFSLGVNIARVYEVDELSSGLVAFSAFLITINNSVTNTYALNNPTGENIAALFEGTGIEVAGNEILVTIANTIPGSHINTQGYFAAMVVGFVASIIFAKLMLRDLTIKLPDSVPPAISKPFLSIIPGLVSLYIVGGLTYVFNMITESNLVDWVYEVLQTPLLGLSQNLFSILLVGILIQLFWFFGLHGGNVMAPIMESTFGVALLANVDAYQSGQEIPYLWTSVTYNAFRFNGTVGLIIAIFLVSKNEHYRQVAKLGLAPALFNIGEPVTYGLPVVLNPIMFIPRLLTPTLTMLLTYFMTSIGWVSPVTQNVTWVMPPILYPFFATGFDWRALVLGIVNIAIVTITYIPFVKMANNQAIAEATIEDDGVQKSEESEYAESTN